jgi:hypothetical protein
VSFGIKRIYEKITIIYSRGVSSEDHPKAEKDGKQN